MLLSLVNDTIIVHSDVNINNGKQLLSELSTILSELQDDNISLDLTEINKYDTFIIIFINKFKIETELLNLKYNIIGFDKNIKSFYETFQKTTDKKTKKLYMTKTKRYSYFESVGLTTMKFYEYLVSYIEFTGELFTYLFKAIYNFKEIRWIDFPTHLIKSGINSIPIVFLILFLIGLVTGYQGAVMLEKFGGDSLIAGLIGISLTRELAPLMTAILIAGRSGSAFAAEIGTMKVSEEIDSLKTMGFDVMNFLVLPRIFAVVISIPFITLIADLAGILGGLLSSVATLDVTISSYFNDMNVALTYAHVFSGVFKSIIFGFIIAAVGCFMGLQVKSGADSVGRYTTNSVVLSIFLIILTDAVFTFLFQTLGI